jgi:hypothetical protein
VLRWLQRSGIGFDEPTALIAASCGHIQTLQYLFNEHTEFALDKALCTVAARSAKLPMLQFLREAGCPWDDTIADEAAMCGSVEVMKWLHEQGIVFSTSTMEQAAKFGRLDLCRYYPLRVARGMILSQQQLVSVRQLLYTGCCSKVAP